MSLYTALTQVLASYAAKINGLLTGWNGTVYSTPGEAVRQQIADLHVLIGDTPGTAIQASAVAYNDSNVAAELTDVNGRLQRQEAVVDFQRKEPDVVTENWGVTNEGYANTNQNYHTFKYLVTPGEEIFCIAPTPARAKASYVFTDNLSISQSNIDNIIGTPATTAVYGKVTVPEGAVYIFFSCLKTDTTSGVYESATIENIVSEIKDVNSKADAYAEKITAVEINPQNLVGMRKDEYYPVNPPIKKGESFTVCVANGETIDSACDVYYYDAGKNQLGNFRLYSNHSKKTVIANDDVAYIRLGHFPAKLLSVVRGNSAKPYSPLAYDYKKYAARIRIADDYYKQRIKYPDSFTNNVYVPTSSHLISQSDNYVSTDPIPLNKGDVLHYNLSTNGAALISLFNIETGAFVDSPVVGNSGGGVMTEGTYTLSEDAYVIISHRPAGVMFDSKSYFYINDSVFRKADTSANENDVLRETFVSSYGTLDGWEPNAIAFSKLMIDTEEAEAFLFFTDTHLMSKRMGAWKPYMYETFSYIEKLYYSTPCTFVLHGGDWLGSGENREDYMYKLSVIGGAFRRNIDKYALVIGNHETAGQSAEHLQLTHNTLFNTLMSRFGGCYYIFKANTFKMYCFDTWDSGALDSYGVTQLKWFADALTRETDSHIVIAMHILYNEQSLNPMGNQISMCADAYNSRSAYVYDGVTYDYSEATGKIGFIIAGHVHGDRTGTANNIPFILTVNTTGYGGEADFDRLPLPVDLIKVDWTNALLTAYRARRDGTGTTRTLQILT